MILGGVSSMKYEDADILAFISGKSKPTQDPEKDASSDKNAGSEEIPGNKNEQLEQKSLEHKDLEHKDLEHKDLEHKDLEKDLLTESPVSDSLPGFEEFPVSSAESPSEVDPHNFLNGGSSTGPTTGSTTAASTLPGEDELPFEAFDDYDFEPSRSVPSLDEAFGIVTTGIEPLEITHSGATITGYIASARRSEIRLGTYVVVPYEGGEKLFARVGKLQYRQEFAVDDATEIHSRRMLNARASPVNEADYKFLACLDPLCILYRKKADSSLTRRMADRIPRPNTPILPVTDRLEVQTGLNIPEEGVFLGHLSVGGELVKTHSEPETVAYYLRNDYLMGDPLIFRHMLVCGSTGTGKTFLSKNILRQFMTEDNRYRLRNSQDKARKNPCLVIMDPQDEYSQIFEDNETLTEEDKFRFESENVTYGRVQSTKAFVAKVEGQKYPGDKSRAEQVEFTIPFSLVEHNSWLIAAAGMSELQYIGLEVLLGDFFKSSVPHTYQNFINHIENEGTRSHYVDSGKLHESSYDGIVRRVSSRFFSKVFDRDATPITEI
ncbi:TPA: ATP-binding protein, partial [Methanosarcina acetivorans]|nr:ATP-binding protein [Methanosarcina acetivorans]